MKLTKRGPYYWVDFREPSGKRRRISTDVKVPIAPKEPTQAEAAAYAGAVVQAEAAAYAKAGGIVQAAMVAPVAVVADPRGTLSAALESTYVAHWGRSKSAVNMRCTVNLLQREFVGVKLADVKTKMLREYCEKWLKGGVAPATVNRRMSAIGVVLTRECEDDDTLVRPKMPHYAEDNTKERYMSFLEEAEIYIEIAKRQAVEQLMKPGVYGDWDFVGDLGVFLVDTGFRFSEGLSFYIDGTQACLGDSKNGKARRVPMTTRAQVAAGRILASPKLAELRARGEKKSWEWVSHRWGVVTAAAGCPDITLHILRHSCASRLIQGVRGRRGVDLYTVSKWLGHSSIKVTERYAHLATDSLSMALAALEQDVEVTLKAA
jgi:integrase